MTETSAWEPIPDAGPTWRLAVPGGWIYRRVYPPDAAAQGEVMCYVPDPKAAHVILPPGTTTIEPEGTART